LAAHILRSVVLSRSFLHAFPARDASDDDVRAALGAPRTSAIVQVRQVHGSVAVEARAGVPAEADAIVARAGGEAVGVRVADCVPILVGDEESGDVAAIHAGWRGVASGVIGAGVRLLGGRKLVAAIGPCIGPCCFEVGTEVVERVGFVARTSGDKAFIDLRAAVRAQLRALGVADDRIEDVAGCTKHEVRFHSFRRDGKESGRMLACIRPAPRH
jgi:YfiH family protein